MSFSFIWWISSTSMVHIDTLKLGIVIIYKYVSIYMLQELSTLMTRVCT